MLAPGLYFQTILASTQQIQDLDAAQDKETEKTDKRGEIKDYVINQNGLIR